MPLAASSDPPPKFCVPVYIYACYVYSRIPCLPFNSTLDIPVSHILKSQTANQLLGWYFSIIAVIKSCDRQLEETLWGDELIHRQALTMKL